MTDQITEVIRKLETYQSQIKEQTKKEIIDMVSKYGENYFDSVDLYACDSELNLIDYRIETVKKIGNAITFININYNPEYLKQLAIDLNKAPALDGSVTLKR